VASLRNRNGVWEVEVYFKGVRKSSCHKLRRDAVAWAAEKIKEFEAAAKPGRVDVPVRCLFERYGREVSVLKAGKRWELIRLNQFSKAAFSDMSVLRFFLRLSPQCVVPKFVVLKLMI